MKYKNTIARLLIAFLLVSIGVAIGKEMAFRETPALLNVPVIPGSGSKVVVYYMHGIPCVTCTFIETTARDIVHNEFADAVASGNMEFVSVDYTERENDALADKYNVGGNMVIAVRFENGQEVASVRLDEVMIFARDAEALANYLRNGISSALQGSEQ